MKDRGRRHEFYFGENVLRLCVSDEVSIQRAKRKGRYIGTQGGMSFYQYDGKIFVKPEEN